METAVQIEVLKRAREEVHYAYGLCRAIRLSVFLKTKESIRDISNIIPLFTYENACKFDSSITNKDKHGYWWPVSQDEPRYKFIDWMIGELEKQLK